MAFDWNSFLRGFRAGTLGRIGLGENEGLAYDAGRACQTYPTHTRSELAAWLQSFGDCAAAVVR
jgi:hypothetical protein